MSLAHSSKVVTANLLLNLDFANSKNYDNRENLFALSESVGTGGGWPWSLQRTTVSGNVYVYSPDEVSTVYKIVEDTASGGHEPRQNVTMYPGVYTSSVYAKAGERTVFTMLFFDGAAGTYRSAHFNLSTGTVTEGNTGLVGSAQIVNVGNGWYRCAITATITGGGASTYIDYRMSTTTTPGVAGDSYTGDGSSGMYFWGAQVEKGSNLNTYVKTVASAITRANTATSTVANLTHTFYNNTSNNYISSSNVAVTFTRSAAAPKHGGGMYTTTTGNLTSGIFLYNDHTWEVWFRIDDIATGAYDGTEGRSCLNEFRGYHAGFEYAANALYYSIWDSTGPTVKTCSSWSVGTSGAQINQGSWYQVVVTRLGNVFTPYVNGAALGTGYTQSFTSAWSGTSNDLHIGSTANAAAGLGSYVYYSKNSIANMKMYNRALTATEIKQNFNALRGRFGI